MIVGTCGNCGGPVVAEPRPDAKAIIRRCEDCGSKPVNNYGPTIPMGPKPDTGFPYNGLPQYINPR